MRQITDALSVGRSATYDRVNRALLAGYLVDLAGRKRGKKIAIGAALPDEDLFLPTGDDLVHLISATPAGQASGSTIDVTGDPSGRPGRPPQPADRGDLDLPDQTDAPQKLVAKTTNGSFALPGDDGFLETLEAAFDQGHLTAAEATERLWLHNLLSPAEGA